MTATTRRFDPTVLRDILCISFELGEGTWKLSFTSGFGEKVFRRRLRSRDREAVLRAIEVMKDHLGLPGDARVVSCYEAGREGFWLHRFLEAHGIENLVVDSSSIEVSRRARRAKTDRLDGESLLDLLLRHLAGSRKKVWSVVRVPTVEEEDRRHLHRELQSAKRDRTRVTNRMKGLLANHGLTLNLKADVPAQLAALRQWDGSPLAEGLQARLVREWERVEFYTVLIERLEGERRELLRHSTDPAIAKVRQLIHLKGHRDEQRLALRDGAVRLAGVSEPQGGGSDRGPDPDPGRERGKGAGEGDVEGGQPPRAIDGDRDRLGLASLPAG